MLTVRSKRVDARAKNIRVVPTVNIQMEPKLQPPRTYKDPLNPQEGWEEDESAHPFFWKLPGMVSGTQMTPSELRWIWNPQTGDMYVGSEGRHTMMTPSGTSGDSVLRGFYFPDRKTVAIRPFYWPQETYDQWDETHADLNADVVATFITAIEPSLKQQEPGIRFDTGINNKWLQDTTGRYSW